VLWDIPPSEIDNWWLKRYALDSSQMDQKEFGK
jgi:hypothetical protein